MNINSSAPLNRVATQSPRLRFSLIGAVPALAPFSLAARNMRTRWLRTGLTCLGIVLGVAVILAISIANDSTLASIRSVFDEASGKASLYVESSSTSQSGFDQSVTARIESTAGVMIAAPAVQATTLLAEDAKDWQFAVSLGGVASGNYLQMLGIDPDTDALVRQYTLIGGRWLKPQRYEALIVEDFAFEKGLSVGEDLTILVPGGVERLRIVGLLRREGAGMLNDGKIVFAPIDVVQHLFDRGGDIDEVSIVTTPEIANSPAQLAALKTALSARLGEKSYTVSYPASRGQLVTQMLSTYQQGLSFFSVVALFVGAFLIYNTFTMTVLERTQEIGMLRALGMTQAQVIGLVLAEALVLAIIGSVAGVLFGVVLAQGLIWMLGAVVGTAVDFSSIPPAGLATSVAIGVAVTLGSALLPAWQAARISPIEALRVRAKTSARVPRRTWISGLTLLVAAWLSLYYVPWPPDISFTAGSISILLLLLGATLTVPACVNAAERVTRPAVLLLFGNEGRLGSGNVQRSSGRTALTVAALMVGLSMVIANSSLAEAFIHDITSWVETALGGDLYVRAPIPMREQFERQLAIVPGVEGITKIRYFSVKVARSQIPAALADQDTILFAAIDPQTYRAVGEFQFAADQGDADDNWARFGQDGALFISTTVADRFGLAQGDTFSLMTRRGEHAFVVAAIAVDFTGQGLIVTGSWDDMERWFGHTGVDRFTISVAPGYTTEQVAQAIEAKYKASRNISIETTEEFKGKILDLSEQSFRLFDVLGLIGIVVAALGVINTLMMNVIERQREIGALRSLGLTRWQTTKMVLAEAATLGAIGGVFGIAFGAVLSQVFVSALNDLNGYNIRFVFVPRLFLTGGFIALVVSQIAALYPAWKAAGVRIVEAIKHE